MKLSAGILLYRLKDKKPEFFLVHPGGPFFRNKNEGWWTVPKGELLPDEKPLDAAVREFTEETGYRPLAPFTELTAIKQKAGKTVLCWATEGDFDPDKITSNRFEIEWPPKSGKKASFPEVDKAGWFNYDEAVKLINESQVSLLDELLQVLKA
jgi:predicted NUDIX family NTP pyrophosphohydrolase